MAVEKKTKLLILQLIFHDSEVKTATGNCQNGNSVHCHSSLTLQIIPSSSPPTVCPWGTIPERNRHKEPEDKSCTY